MINNNTTIAIVIGFAVLILVVVLVFYFARSPSPPPPTTEDKIEEAAVEAGPEKADGDMEEIDPAAAHDGSAVFNQGDDSEFTQNYHSAMTTRPEMTATRDRPDRMTRYHGTTDGILKAAGRGHAQGEVGSQIPAMMPMSS